VASLREQLKTLTFERDLADIKAKRLTGEVQTLQSQLASIQADRSILQNRLADRERYVQAVEASLGWRIVERIRKVLGRGWK
jgi:chromosome segregation ATPase